ncbi:MAG: DUF2304 domain-containing protein [Nitrospirota bacterium]
MTPKLKAIAVLIGVFLFLYIIELVRRRKLREEYAWLWLVTGAIIILLSIWYDLLVAISDFIGGILPSSVLFFFGMVFLLIILLHMSVKISSLAGQVKTLAQELAIFKKDKEKTS